MTYVACEHAIVLRELLCTRHSCRAFLGRPVPHSLIVEMMALAQRTPSWCNSQPWQVIVTTGEATGRLRDALRGAPRRSAAPDIPFPTEYRGVYAERRRACGYQLYESVGLLNARPLARRRQDEENLNFFGAPHVALVTTDAALGAYGVLDCGAFIANFMLAATSVGVATIAQASIAAHAEAVRAHVGLAADRQLVCGISFGYEDRDHPVNRFRTDRAAVADVLTVIE